MKVNRKIISLVLSLSLFFACGENVLASIPNSNPRLSPLQERLNRDSEITGEEIAEEISDDTIYDYELLDEINNNPITVLENNNTDESADAEEISDEQEEHEETTDEEGEIAQEEIPTDEEYETEYNDSALVEEENLLMLSSSSSVPSSFNLEPVNSVYNVLNNNNDYVSQATGTLTYSKELLSLQGRNGLDLDLSVRYNSADAVVTENEFENSTSTNQKFNFNNFAAGWNFNFTTIVKTKGKYGYGRRAQLCFTDGSSYRIAHDSMYGTVTEDKTLTLEGYTLSDMTLKRVASTQDYELTYSNGRVEVFDHEQGYIKQIRDMFGNEINFEWSELDYYRGSFLDYIFKPSYYDGKIVALTKITDSVGRIINIEYDIATTVYGKEVKQINVKMNNILYAKIFLDRVDSLNGSVDVVSKITDAENYVTKYSYGEKVAHIYNSGYEETYSVNGSIFALEKIELPTGGYVKYEYEKARRAYSYYIPYVTFTDWYEVFKISKVSDSSGFERTYKYENDYSGYPYSYLNINPDDDNTYTSTQYTGYVYSNSFLYTCITEENNVKTVSVFNYQHNKIKEQSFSAENTQNDYIVRDGDTKWQVLSGNSVYHLGIRNSTSSTSSGKLYLYRQNLSTGEIEILRSIDTTIPSTAQIKGVGNNIYVFYKTGDSYSNSYKLNAKEYNTQTETWSDGGEISLSNDVGNKLGTSNVCYSNSKFYFWSYYNVSYGDDYFYCAEYNTSNQTDYRWSVHTTETSIGSYPFVYVCHASGNLYFNHDRTIYEYNLQNHTMSTRYFNSISRYSMSGGFAIGDQTYLFDGYKIYEFDYQSTTANVILYFSSSNAISEYLSNSGYFYSSNYTIQKGADGNIYYVMKTNASDGTRKIYRFNPDATDDKFECVGSRLANNEIKNIISAGTADEPIIYIISDGTEIIKLYEPQTPQSTRRTSYSYNSYNQPTTIVNERLNGANVISDGTEIYAYINGKSNVTSYTDILGNTTKYEYDVTYYLPTKITSYYGTDKETETINVLSNDHKKIVSSQTDYSDKKLKTLYSYDSEKEGNVISEELYESPPNSEVFSLLSRTEYNYDSNKYIVEGTTNKNVRTNDASFTEAPMQDITVTSVHDNLGRVTSETDALGRTTYYGYNNNGWNTWTVFPDETTVDIFYNLDGINGGENTITTVYNENYTVTDYFDDLGRQILQSEKPANGNESVLLEYEYDGHNINKKTDGNGNYSLYDYDSFNRVISVTGYNADDEECSSVEVNYNDFELSSTLNNSGKVSKTYYDIAGREIGTEMQTAAGLAITSSIYDCMGNVIRTVSPKGEQIQYSYNNRGLLQSVTDSQGHITSYTYDAYKNPLTVTNAGQIITTNEYDSLGRVISTFDAMGNESKFAYDANGRIITSLDRNGITTSYTYKSNTDYISKQTTGSMEIDYTYDSFGNILTATNYTGTYTYAYTYNNLLQDIEAPDGKEISYMYDGNHNVSRVTDYSNDIIDYEYDGNNNVSSIKRNNTAVASYEYYPYGALQRVTYPGQGKSEYTYDNALRLVNQVNSLSDNTVVNSYGYTYDLNGNQTQKNDTGNITNYTYDSLNRLQSVTEPDGTQTAYTFDTQGNIMTKSISHPSGFEFDFTQDGIDRTLTSVLSHEFTYAYDNNNRLKFEGEYVSGTGTGFSGNIEITKYSDYDNNGNLLVTNIGGQIDDKVVRYTYNPLNQLSQYTDEEGNRTNYFYSPDGMRNTKIQADNTTKYYWDRNYMSAESVDGNITAKNYIGTQGIFARETTDGTDYMLKNGHGDVVSLVNNGTVSKIYDYDAYGVEKNLTATDTNPFRYCGEYQDIESGQLYLRNRYYDPAASRMLSEDPARAGTNWYIYCNNNPVNYVDPSGLDAIVITTSTMSVYGNAHTSVLAQDNGGNWYYFYWGNKNAVLLEVPADKLTDLGTFNAWLVENGAGKAGKKTDKQLHDSSDEYTTGTYIEGDFSASVSYFLEQAIGANMSEEIKGGKHEYKNNSYGLFGNNCMTVSFGGLKKGTLTDGTNFGDFAKFDGEGSIRPNDFRVMIRETFANQEFTRLSARNSAIGNIGVKKPRYMNQNYYNQGQKYGKMLRGY